MVLSRSVEISKTAGWRKYIVSVLEPGEVFGQLGYFGAIKGIATAHAIGETTLGVIDRVFLDKEFNRLSGYFRNILIRLVKKFGTLIDRVSQFSSRKEDRAQKSLSVTFKDRQAFVKAYTHDITRSGLFIRTQHPLKKGEQFLLNLQLSRRSVLTRLPYC